MRIANSSKDSRKALEWSAALTIACALHASLFVLTESPPKQLAVLSATNISGQTEHIEFSVALEQQRSDETESAASPAISQPTAASRMLLGRAHSAANAHTMKKESPLPQISDFDVGNAFHGNTSNQRIGVRGTRSFAEEGITSSRGAAPSSPGTAVSDGAFSSTGSSRTSALKVRLLASASCADLFPYQAKSDLGTVLVELTVDATGTSHFSKVIEETPRGQGFGRAAEKCAQRLRFSTSWNIDDPSLQAHPIVRLEFEKSS